MKKERIGKQIETLGNVLLVVMFAGGLICGLLLVTGGRLAEGCGVIIGGLLAAWFTTLLLRGFGRLVENSDRCAELLQYIAEHLPDKY